MDVPVYLDGQKISHNAMKHMIAGFNSAAGGSRMPDYAAVRPQ
jgi:hypothetical protein